MQNQVITFANLKGGVGKSQVCSSTAAALAERGFRCLVVDTDPQGTISNTLNLEIADPEATVYEVVMGRRPIADTILATNFGFDCVPALESLQKAAVELLMETSTPWQFRLRDALEDVSDRYDYTLIDTCPGSGALSSLGMVAANFLIVPTQIDAESLRRANETLAKAAVVKSAGKRPYNPGLKVLGVLGTMVQPRTVATKGLWEAAIERGFDLIEPPIPFSTVAREANIAQMPVFAYAPTHPIADAYRALAARIISASQREEAVA